MNLFYTEQVFEKREPVELLLKEQEASHATKVLRLDVGDPIHVTDGKGTIYHGVIKSQTPDEVLVTVQEQIAHPAPTPEIILAVGLIKKRDRLEFAIEKAAELGITRFVVFTADRSEKKGVRLDRLEAAAQSAMKQSLRAWLPTLLECDSLDAVLKEHQGIKTIVADEQEEPGSAGRRVWNRHQQLLFVVGPEGGFSDREREILDRAGAERFSLGRHRLRTETAVVALASLFLE